MSRDVVAAKADIYAAMCANEHKSQLTADKRWAARICVLAYQEALGMYVSRRLSKKELEKVVYRVLGVENIRKHNTLLLSLLADATRRRAFETKGNMNLRGPTRRQLSRPLVQSDTAENVGDSDDEILALRREWRRTGMATVAPQPRVLIDQRFPRNKRGLVANARLDGASLVALKMNDISIGVGLEGVSASAVHLMTMALHTYARRMIKQCHAEFNLRRTDDDKDGKSAR